MVPGSRERRAHMTVLVALAIGGFFASTLLVGLIRRYARRAALMDIPNERSSHTAPTPRGGGLGIVLSYSAGVLALALSGVIGWTFAMVLLATSLAVSIVGFLDDRGGMPVSIRFTVHLAASAAFTTYAGIGTLLGISWLDAVPVVSFVIVWLAMTWLLNLFNFMDGIDGIAATEAICVAASLAITANRGTPDASLAFCVLLSAACAGFLCWNWAPARIFMGDVGSGFLGFVIGALCLSTVRDTGISGWVPLILLAVFVSDATLTLLRRVARGERWAAAHRMHAYQWLSRRWRSHARVVLAMIAVNVLWLLPLAVWAARRPQQAGWIALLAYLPVVVACAVSGAGRPEVRPAPAGQGA